MAELFLLVLAERVAALPQQRRRFQAADADQGEVEFLPRLHDLADGRVPDQGPAQRRAADQPGRGQQHRPRPGDRGQVAGKPVRLHLDAGVAVAADDLHHAVQRGAGPGRHGLGRGEQCRAPGRHAEDLAAGERGVQVLRRSRAEGGDDLAPGTLCIDHYGVAEAVPVLKPFLQVGVHARRQGDDGTDDAEVAGLAEQPGHARLGHAQLGGDLRLPDAALVVHARHLGDEPELCCFNWSLHHGPSASATASRIAAWLIAAEWICADS